MTVLGSSDSIGSDDTRPDTADGIQDNTEESSPDSAGTPQTGDEMALTLLLFLFGGALVGGVALILFHHRALAHLQALKRSTRHDHN
jgi:hypothetical protein